MSPDPTAGPSAPTAATGPAPLTSTTAVSPTVATAATTADGDAAPSAHAVTGDADDPPSSPEVLTSDDRSTSAQVVDLDALGALLGRVLAAEGIPAHAEASLTLVDPEVIAQLKVEHLDGTGAPTDVLSFPIDGAEGDDGSWMVGDIVLCAEVAFDQAPGHAGTFADELALLVVHGALHLVGWDHAEDEERRAMWSRERELLAELHGVPSRDPWTDAADDESDTDTPDGGTATPDPVLPREGLN